VGHIVVRRATVRARICSGIIHKRLISERTIHVRLKAQIAIVIVIDPIAIGILQGLDLSLAVKARAHVVRS